MYDRQAAVDYAKTYWNRPCDDGVIGIIGGSGDITVDAKKREFRLPEPSSWGAQFKPTPDGAEAAFFVRSGHPDVKFQGWAGLGDCAHFISRCLSAGGVKTKLEGVPKMHSFLAELPDTKTLADAATFSQADQVIGTDVMRPGDVILYRAPAGGELGGGYVHSALFVSNNTISCHTICRFGKPWYLDDAHKTYTFTLVHFADDDRPSILSASLNGWWDVPWHGGHYYYWFGNGVVRATMHRPAGPAPLHYALHHGYYFSDALSTKSYKIFWIDTGSRDKRNGIEAWSLDGSSGKQTGKLSDGTITTATKMSFHNHHGWRGQHHK